MFALVPRLLYRKRAFSQLRRMAMRKPTSEELFTMRTLIFFALILLGLFLHWFFQPEHRGVTWLFWLLTIAMLFKILRWLHEWYHYFSISYPEKPKRRGTPEKPPLTVDMLTTFCAGEPYDMVVDTLKGMVAVRYPHTTYLCDEANDPYLKSVCEKLGVVHVTRTLKVNAKAGNINNALKQATGDIAVVLDPDHKPVKHFLDVVLPYFEDPEIGFVQVVQAYGNQAESYVARGAAEQTYQFYGPLMMGMSSYGTAQAIGANCSFRRTALDSIGGHAAGLSEDMHTAMQIHAKAWKSIYVPEVLTMGLAPSSLSAFFQQQLKWSRGTFELLFTSYLQLFTKFTWRQKLHYFTIALYFLSGLISLIDIAVPVIALLTAEAVWKIDLTEFMLMFLPLMGVAMLIRIYSQRWLPQKSERGAHLAGGILQLGTWWIYLLGFICTLLRIKIPYIPTPKDNDARNDWKLSLPNLIAAGVSIAAIPIGLKLDWSPFSFFMASFAAVNAMLLIFISLMAQQKFLLQIGNAIRKLRVPKMVFGGIRGFLNHNYDILTGLMRKAALVPGVLIFAFAFSNEMIEKTSEPEYNLDEIKPPVVKDCGGFYTGIYMPDIEKSQTLNSLTKTEKQLNTQFDIVSIYMAWGPESGAPFPDSVMKQVVAHKSIPMVTWEPWTWPFPEYRQHEDLCCEKKVLQYITKGYFDNYLDDYARRFKSLNAPVMIRFAHEFDNPAYPWSTKGGNSPEDFVAAWRHVVNYFDSLGASNVVWVWNPWEEDGLEKYYPGDEYVDWIGVTNLNYGLSSSGGWYEMEGLYRPFSEKIKKYNKPVLLTEFGSTTFGGNQSAWLANAFTQIEKNFPEVKGCIFFYSDNDPHWGFSSWRPADGSTAINWTFTDPKALQVVKDNLQKPYFNAHPLAKVAMPPAVAPNASHNRTKYLEGGPGNYQLIVDGKPFYVQGIVYNGGSDWRDGDIPLTRSKVEDDFQKIRDMGANTIRRYDPSIYDHNLLTIAEEKGLKVLYGFWFEQGVDYAKDEKVLKEYQEKVERAVLKYRDSKAVLGWNIGNEVWGLSKQYYAEPYLSAVRRNYVVFIEKLARRIHELDPNHPVFIAEEHSSELPAAIGSLRDGAPSVDVVGVNSYYHKHITKLQGIMTRMDTTRPYLVSEFGPEGYWQPDFTKTDAYGAVVEDGSVRKAHLYERRWLDMIQPYKGLNVGGIAYCWTDRLEGTATWFGVTDSKGNMKPSYCALKKVWTGQTCSSSMNEVYIFSPEEALDAGHEYTFFAVTDNAKSQDLKYEWYLCKDEFVQLKDKVKVEESGRQVRVVIPDDPSAYRLYVNVSNSNGYCNTASLALPAHRKTLNKERVE